MSTIVDPAKTREARRLAARANAAARTFAPAARITVAEIAPGDFVEVVPTQQGIRGTRFDCTVGVTTTTMDAYVVRTGRRGASWPVEAVTITPANTALVGVTYPSTFIAVVRKALS